MSSQKKQSYIVRESDYLKIYLPNSIGVDDTLEMQSKIESSVLPKNDQVVFDFSETTALYSPGLGMLIRLKKIITESGGAVSLVNVSKRIRKILIELNLDKIFPIYATDIEFEMSQDAHLTGSGQDDALIFSPHLEENMYTIMISGHLTAANEVSELISFTPQSGITSFKINLIGLDIIDSHGSKILVDFITALEKLGGTSALFGANKVVQNLLELAAPKPLSFFESEEEAQGFLASP